MEIRTLQYFLAVAREQNMTGAANAAQLIRTGITSALGIDELFQLQTPDLVFIPLEPAVTISCLVAWKNTSSCRRRAKPF